MTEQEIIDEMAKIKEAQAHWKHYQDGSYEMALHNAGYTRLQEQLNALRESAHER